MTLRIDGDAKHLAEIHVGRVLQEARVGIKRDFGHGHRRGRRRLQRRRRLGGDRYAARCECERGDDDAHTLPRRLFSRVIRSISVSIALGSPGRP